MYHRSSISLRIVDSLFRHRWLFLLSMAIVSGVTMTALYLRSTTYQATALTHVVTQDVAAELGVSQNNPYLSPSQENVDHFNDLINDDLPGGFLDTALKRAGLTAAINVDPQANDPRCVLLRKHLTASPQSDKVFAISLTWNNAHECEQIVSAMQKQYIEELGQDRAAESTAAGKFLDSQIKDYESRLRGAEQALIDYKKHNFGQLPDAENRDIEQLASLQAQLDNLQITARDSDLKTNALRVRIAQIKPMSILEQTSGESPYERKINELTAERDAMLAHLLPTHPNVIALNQQIAYLKQQLASKQKAGAPEASHEMQTKLQQNPEYMALQQQLTEAQISGQTQLAQMQHLRQEIAQYQTRLQQMPAQERELTNKTRDYSILKEQYESLLKRREDIKVKGDLDKISASSSLNPIGEVYAEPTTGKTKWIVMVIGSLLLGLVAGILLVVLSEWSDHSLRDEADAERLLGVPILALLPETRDLRFLSGAALPPPPAAQLETSS